DIMNTEEILQVSNNNKHPTISIIIATYNCESDIKGCLDSIISQPFENWEVIIIDGESTDRTIEIIKEFNNEKVRLLSEKDNGIYDALNKGIKLAKGDWLY